MSPIPTHTHTDIKGIPEFWQTVLLKCDTTAEMIRDKDLDVLKYLNDISSEGLVSEEGGSIGFKLTFHFDTNPYFSNTVGGDNRKLLRERLNESFAL